jgi:hypothetical protein
MALLIRRAEPFDRQTFAQSQQAISILPVGGAPDGGDRANGLTQKNASFLARGHARVVGRFALAPNYLDWLA